MSDGDPPPDEGIEHKASDYRSPNELVYQSTDASVPTGIGQVLPSNGVVTVTAQMVQHSGLLPPPGQFAQYEAAYPGAAKWILDEASAAASHTRVMERSVLALQGRDAFLRRLLPFGFVLAFLAASVGIAVLTKNAVWGAAGIGGTLVAVGIAYLRGAHGGPVERPPQSSDSQALEDPNSLPD